jgi:hypothetical protein
MTKLAANAYTLHHQAGEPCISPDKPYPLSKGKIAHFRFGKKAVF